MANSQMNAFLSVDHLTFLEEIQNVFDGRVPSENLIKI